MSKDDVTVVGIDFTDVEQFVDSAIVLAQSLEKDITKGDKLSSATIVALAQFIKSQHAMQPLIDMIDSNKAHYN